MSAAAGPFVVTEPGLMPGSPEWLRLITASKVAAILGLSPWESPRSVWHAMHGDLPREEANEVQSRGHFLEPAILAWWRSQHADTFDWDNHTAYDQQVFHLGDWAAATPDLSIHPLAPPERPGSGRLILDPVALVEAKSAAHDDEWGTPGTDEIPAYYLAQVIWQMHVSGAQTCYVPMIGPRLKFAEYVVRYGAYAEDAKVIEARMREFYDSLAAEVPPPLDDTVATYDAVRKVHPEIERGQSVELTSRQARDLVLWCDELKAAERSTRLAKSTVLEAMGRAQYATHAGVRIARRQPRGDDVSFVVLAKPDDLPEKEPTT